jgi:hypothetical protein
VSNIRPDLRLPGFPFQPPAGEVIGFRPPALALMSGVTGPSAGFDPSESISPLLSPDSSSRLPNSFLAPSYFDGPYGPISLVPNRVPMVGQAGPGYVPAAVTAALTQPSLGPRIEKQPGIKLVPETPPQRPILGIQLESLKDPFYQPPLHIEVPGAVPPRIEYWPHRDR